MFSLVLPAYNEASRLEKCVLAVRKELSGISYEIIIAEDGSKDGTDKIAEKLAKRYRNVRHLHNDKKLGRGMALKNAFSHAKGSSMGYIDVDMATDARYLKELVRYSFQFDAVTGSRYAKGSSTSRPLARSVVSRAYNLMIRFFLGVPLNDAQCGFKAFSKRFVKKEIIPLQEKSWAWDTVVMATAFRKGYSVKEFPVDWIEKKESAHSASVKRIWSDIRIHGKVLLKLFAKFRLGLDIEM